MLDNNTIALYGAGQNGRWVCEYLLAMGYQVTCFIDNDKIKYGKYINDIPIISFTKYRQMFGGGGLS